MSRTLIIFDIDGTLVYSNRVDSLCFSSSYEEVFGRTFPSIDWRVFPHVTDHTIFRTAFHREFGHYPDEKEEQIFQDHFVQKIQLKRQTNPEEFHQVPFAKETVNKLLSNENFLCGIATGGWRRPALTKLDFVGIPTDQLIMSFADGKDRREDIVGEVIDLAKKQYTFIDRIVYVGDAIWDVQTTRNMQIPLVGIRREGDGDILRKEGVEWILQDYQDYDYFLKAVREALPPS